MRVSYPFSAIVGQEELRRALLANAVNPAIGGVLLRGERGTAKSTIVRALTGVLPSLRVVPGCSFNCDPAAPAQDCPSGVHGPVSEIRERKVPLVNLPIGATLDRLTGSLDVQAALTDGRRHFQPGLLAAANRGILYVDEVNLLGDHLVDALLDAAAMGENIVERDGISVRHSARFMLIGTMNPEEGDLRPQLLDRFGLSVDVMASREPGPRAEIVRRQLEFERDPQQFADRFANSDAELGALIARGRALLPQVMLDDASLELITRACAVLGVDGVRADIVVTKTASALAALAGREVVEPADIFLALKLAIPHRRRRGPLEAWGVSDQELDKALLDGPSEMRKEPFERFTGTSHRLTEQLETGAAQSTGSESAEALEATAQKLEQIAETAGRIADKIQIDKLGEGPAGKRSRALSESGTPVGDKRYQPGRGGKVSAIGTLRAAAPHQAARGRTAGGLQLEPDDLREQVVEGKEGNLVLFVVDASSSMMADARMRLVKEAVLALLVDAYRKRDKVGMVSFRGKHAEVLLAPTSSVDVAARRLAELPTGGSTPLYAGIEKAGELVRAERRRNPQRRPVVVLVTDGGANVGRGAHAFESAVREAKRLVEGGVEMVVLDSGGSDSGSRQALRLANSVGAPLLPLNDLDASGLADVARQAATPVLI